MPAHVLSLPMALAFRVSARMTLPQLAQAMRRHVATGVAVNADHLRRLGLDLCRGACDHQDPAIRLARLLRPEFAAVVLRASYPVDAARTRAERRVVTTVFLHRDPAMADAAARAVRDRLWLTDGEVTSTTIGPC